MSVTSDVERAAAHNGDAATGAPDDVYRPLPTAAVASCLLGVISIVALLEFWPTKALPAIGLIAGLIALRQIAQSPDEFSGRKVALLGVALSSFFLIAGSAVSLLVPILEVPADHVKISYEDLKPSADRPHAVPAEAAELDGKKVFIKGFMFPTTHVNGIRKFLLCRDNGDCCFGGQPPSSDMVWVELNAPLETEFNTRLRHVGGTFHVTGSHLADVRQEILYRLDADYIK
jgi:hypothetical protein